MGSGGGPLDAGRSVRLRSEWQARFEVGEIFELGGYPVRPRKKQDKIDDPRGLLRIRHIFGGHLRDEEIGPLLGRVWIGALSGSSAWEIPVGILTYSGRHKSRGRIAVLPLAALARLLGAAADRVEAEPEDPVPRPGEDEGGSQG